MVWPRLRVVCFCAGLGLVTSGVRVVQGGAFTVG